MLVSACCGERTAVSRVDCRWPAAPTSNCCGLRSADTKTMAKSSCLLFTVSYTWASVGVKARHGPHLQGTGAWRKPVDGIDAAAAALLQTPMHAAGRVSAQAAGLTSGR